MMAMVPLVDSSLFARLKRAIEHSFFTLFEDLATFLPIFDDVAALVRALVTVAEVQAGHPAALSGRPAVRTFRRLALHFKAPPPEGVGSGEGGHPVSSSSRPAAAGTSGAAAAAAVTAAVTLPSGGSGGGIARAVELPSAAMLGRAARHAVDLLGRLARITDDLATEQALLGHNRGVSTAFEAVGLLLVSSAPLLDAVKLAAVKALRVLVAKVPAGEAPLWHALAALLHASGRLLRSRPKAQDYLAHELHLALRDLAPRVGASAGLVLVSPLLLRAVAGLPTDAAAAAAPTTVTAGRGGLGSLRKSLAWVLLHATASAARAPSSSCSSSRAAALPALACATAAHLRPCPRLVAEVAGLHGALLFSDPPQAAALRALLDAPLAAALRPGVLHECLWRSVITGVAAATATRSAPGAPEPASAFAASAVGPSRARPWQLPDIAALTFAVRLAAMSSWGRPTAAEAQRPARPGSVAAALLDGFARAAAAVAGDSARGAGLVQQQQQQQNAALGQQAALGLVLDTALFLLHGHSARTAAAVRRPRSSTSSAAATAGPPLELLRCVRPAVEAAVEALSKQALAPAASSGTRGGGGGGGGETWASALPVGVASLGPAPWRAWNVLAATLARPLWERALQLVASGAAALVFAGPSSPGASGAAAPPASGIGAAASVNAQGRATEGLVKAFVALLVGAASERSRVAMALQLPVLCQSLLWWWAGGAGVGETGGAPEAAPGGLLWLRSALDWARTAVAGGGPNASCGAYVPRILHSSHTPARTTGWCVCLTSVHTLPSPPPL